MTAFLARLVAAVDAAIEAVIDAAVNRVISAWVEDGAESQLSGGDAGDQPQASPLSGSV